MAMLLFKRGDYAFTFDLKSGNHYVDVYEKHWTYLGFQWPIGSKLQYLYSGCYHSGWQQPVILFTKLLRPLVRYWRQQGIQVMLYLDDGMVGDEG